MPKRRQLKTCAQSLALARLLQQKKRSAANKKEETEVTRASNSLEVEDVIKVEVDPDQVPEEESHCLFCDEAVEDGTCSWRGSDLEGNFVTMFILKKMLSVASEKLKRYLLVEENPSNWITFCEKCQPLVEEAVNLQKEIGRLEVGLRECQEEMMRRIRKRKEKYELKSLSEIIAAEARKLCVTALRTQAIGRSGKLKMIVTPYLKHPRRLMVRYRSPPPSQEESTASVISEEEEPVPEKEDPPLPQRRSKRRRVPSPEVPREAEEIEQVSSVVSSTTTSDNNPEAKEPTKRKKLVKVPPAPSTQETALISKLVASLPPWPSAVTSETSDPTEPGAVQEGPQGGDEDMDFDFGELPSPAESHSNDADPPTEIPETNQIKVTRAESKALNKGTFNCQLCPDMTDMSMFQLANHLMFHYRRPFKCPECHLYYSNDIDVTSRMSIPRLGDTPSHQCRFLDLLTPKPDPSTSLYWRCSFCPEHFSTPTARDLHETSTHPEEDLMKLPPKKYPCRICPSSSFRNLAEWRLHRVLEHPHIDAMSCFYCDATFPCHTKDDIEFFDDLAMANHIYQEHNITRKTSRHLLLLPNECLLCGATFSSAGGLDGLNTHTEKCHGLPPNQSFECPMCPAKRCTRNEVRTHVKRIHLNAFKNRFLCDLCVYSSTVIFPLEEHRFKEHGIVPENREVLQCSEEGCGFQCLEKRKLDRHRMKEHGAERKIKCKYCGQGFLAKRHCQTHEMIHENATSKPFQCEACGKSFKTDTHLYGHTVRVHRGHYPPSAFRKRERRNRAKARAEEPSSSGTINEIN